MKILRKIVDRIVGNNVTEATTESEDESDESESDLHENPPDSIKNRTDYDFPRLWHRYTVEEKIEWYVRERVFRQATRQDTSFGRRYREVQDGTVEDEQRGEEMAEAWKQAGRGGYRHDSDERFD